jgi:hypothetical protein
MGAMSDEVKRFVERKERERRQRLDRAKVALGRLREAVALREGGPLNPMIAELVEVVSVVLDDMREQIGQSR